MLESIDFGSTLVVSYFYRAALDILIYTLIAAQSLVNSGGATKQKSNFRKI
jgi:hypothetical protein